MSFFHSFQWNIIHNRIHCFTLRKKNSSKNYFTIVVIMQFFKKYRPLRFHIWLKYYFKNILGIKIKNIGWVFWSLGNMLSICFRFSQICFSHVLWNCLVIPGSHLGCWTFENPVIWWLKSNLDNDMGFAMRSQTLYEFSFVTIFRNVKRSNFQITITYQFLGYFYPNMGGWMFYKS